MLGVSALHLSFLILEMFYWTKPIGLKIFRQSLQKAEASKALAANQGLYNGFLVAGLIWAITESDALLAYKLKIFFLSCVVLAGCFGALSVSRKIFWVQAFPAIWVLFLITIQKLMAL